MKTFHEKTGRFSALILLFFVISFLSQGCQRAVDVSGLADGDLIFQNAQSSQCAAISAATHSPYTHVGLIFIKNGQPVVYEAVQPVCVTPLAEWISRGKDGQYVVKRLADPAKIQQPDAIAQLNTETEKYLGKGYDWAFGWSDDRIYCSELVWKSYQRALGIELAPLKRLKDFDLTSPAVKKVMAERYGTDVPYDEKVISPADLFNSPILVEVKRGN